MKLGMPHRIFVPFLFAFVLVAVTASDSFAEKRKKDEPITGENGHPYVHICAAGTEPIGVVGKQMWCRQPVSGGYRRQGAFIEWYSNGKKRTTGEFDRDRKHGIWTRYYPNGKKRDEAEYFNGKEVRKSKYDRRGKPVDNSASNERKEKSREMTKKLREAHSWKKPREWK